MPEPAPTVTLDDELDCLAHWFEAYPSEIACQLDLDDEDVLRRLIAHRDAGRVVSREDIRRIEAYGVVHIDRDRYRLTSAGWQEVMNCGDDALSCLLLEECDARGWSLLDLARAMGDRDPTVAALALTLGMACWRDACVVLGGETIAGLARAFGTSAELWRNLDTARRLGYPRGKLPDPATIQQRIAERMRAQKEGDDATE